MINFSVRFSSLDVQNVGCLISVKNVAILGANISSLQALLMGAQGVLCLRQAWQSEFYLRF
jgi:hypothetical protein